MPDRSEDGFTMVELLVTMMILAIVLAIGFSFLVQATALTARSERNVQAEKDAQFALRTITQELRGLDPSETSACTHSGWPTDPRDCLKFTVRRNSSASYPCPKTVFSVAIVGTELKLDREDYNAVGATCPTVSRSALNRTVLSGVVNSSSEDLFTFYGSDATTLDPTPASFSFGSVDSVLMQIKLRHTNGAAPIDLRTVVALRNNNDR